ncbi:MAG TPA: Panacea domain-containing protein, partial [bacterium]|nr:Panacea domain-containing protein [bacterium]
MSPKLEAVLARLIKQLGPIYKTQAVKMPYIVDVLAQRVLGQPITGGTHRAWDHGVVTQEVYHGLGESPYFRLRQIEGRENQQRVCLVQTPECDLSEAEREIVDFVAREYGRMKPRDLGIFTKRMNPDIPPKGWGQNALARTDHEAYIHMGEPWQRFAEKLEALKPSDLADQS